eukprot:TRINITY_DN3181_c1_g5_i3.p1 TRINITY_DN3181_c1_g5~~TRINITY_DN3181_c1_g5_i3.p1  ORF type:complete len:269 (+),score=54.15 TRINITY_DN3181_c1_g5_i3:270-1076(+)
MFCYYYSKWKKRLLFAALQMQEKSQLILSQGLVLQSHFSSNSLFWFEEHGPEEVYIITSKDKYLSASLDGQIVGEKTKKDPSCIFRVSSQGPESISLRTIFGTYVSVTPDKEFLVATAVGTRLGREQMFTKFYPNNIISFRLAATPSPFVSALANRELKASAVTIKETEQFQVRTLTGNIVTIKSCALHKDVAVDSKGKLKVEDPDNLHSTRSGRWILERQETGTTRIKSVQTDTYIILSRSGTLGMSSNPRDTPAEFHLVYHFNTQI